MKLKQTALFIIGLLPIALSAQTTTPPAVPPSIRPGGPPPGVMPVASAQPTEMPPTNKLSYAIGMFFGNNIKTTIQRGGVDVDTNRVVKGISDILSGKPSEMTEKEVTDIMNQLRAALATKHKREADEVKSKGEAFLVSYAKEPGVTKLPSGVEYQVLKDGSGPLPKDNDTVSVNYTGMLTDGTVFDKGTNFTTAVKGRIIQGWQQILPLMKMGSKVKVVIPSALAYGPRGSQPKIPPDAVLVFEMELLSIIPGNPTLPPIKPASSAAPSPNLSTPVVSGQIIKVPSAEEIKKGAPIEVIDGNQTNVVPSAPASVVKTQ